MAMFEVCPALAVEGWIPAVTTTTSLLAGEPRDYFRGPAAGAREVADEPRPCPGTRFGWSLTQSWHTPPARYPVVMIGAVFGTVTKWGEVISDFPIAPWTTVTIALCMLADTMEGIILVTKVLY